METDSQEKLVTLIRDSSELLNANETQYASLLHKIGDARFVLIGEASHGTLEFYQARMEITKQLILNKEFMAVAIEGDWPDVNGIHRYLQAQNNHDTQYPEQALNAFERFPRWMWRNESMPPFIKWLRQYNDTITSNSKKIGFYGLDLYSLNASMDEVIRYLSNRDPNAAKRARERYACFDHMSIDPETYGFLISAGIKRDCEDEVIEQLIELQHKAMESQNHLGIQEEDDYFFATQNARLVKNAEYYYRTMFKGRVSSWNIRDTHMADTVDVLAKHLEKRHQRPAKLIIWAHNSHLGDARATELSERGEVNLGQLLQERHKKETYSIGFSTYDGFVTAADNWGEPPQCKSVVPALQGSYEALFHEVGHPAFILHCHDNNVLAHYLDLPRLQRAIGVVYRPETERVSHYFFARLPSQFDSMIHFDRSNALKPLDKNFSEQDT